MTMLVVVVVVVVVGCLLAGLLTVCDNDGLCMRVFFSLFLYFFNFPT